MHDAIRWVTSTGQAVGPRMHEYGELAEVRASCSVGTYGLAVEGFPRVS